MGIIEFLYRTYSYQGICETLEEMESNEDEE